MLKSVPNKKSKESKTSTKQALFSSPSRTRRPFDDRSSPYSPPKHKLEKRFINRLFNFNKKIQIDSLFDYQTHNFRGTNNKNRRNADKKMIVNLITNCGAYWWMRSYVLYFFFHNMCSCLPHSSSPSRYNIFFNNLTCKYVVKKYKVKM